MVQVFFGLVTFCNGQGYPGNNPNNWNPNWNPVGNNAGSTTAIPKTTVVTQQNTQRASEKPTSRVTQATTHIVPQGDSKTTVPTIPWDLILTTKIMKPTGDPGGRTTPSSGGGGIRAYFLWS